MAAAPRNTILLTILEELRDREITVTGVRDMILKRYPEEGVDSATLRRWVNGRFISLVKSGFLTQIPKGGTRRSFFKIAHTGEKAFKSMTKQNPAKDNSNKPKIQAGEPSCFQILRDELENHRLKALTEFSEIDEYKRVIKQYPDLSAKTTEKFNAAIEENCKTLGRIKALEEVLEYKALHS